MDLTNLLYEKLCGQQESLDIETGNVKASMRENYGNIANMVRGGGKGLTLVYWHQNYGNMRLTFIFRVLTLWIFTPPFLIGTGRSFDTFHMEIFSNMKEWQILKVYFKKYTYGI